MRKQSLRSMSSSWRLPAPDATIAHSLMATEITWYRNTNTLEREIKRLRSEVGIMAKRYHGARKEVQAMVIRLRAQPPPPIPPRDPVCSDKARDPPANKDKEGEAEVDDESYMDEIMRDIDRAKGHCGNDNDSGTGDGKEERWGSGNSGDEMEVDSNSDKDVEDGRGEEEYESDPDEIEMRLRLMEQIREVGVYMEETTCEEAEETERVIQKTRRTKEVRRVKEERKTERAEALEREKKAAEEGARKAQLERAEHIREMKARMVKEMVKQFRIPELIPEPELHAAELGSGVEFMEKEKNQKRVECVGWRR